jgi:TonB family protein
VKRAPEHIGALGSLLLHCVLALVLILAHVPRPKPLPQLIQVDVRKPPPPVAVPTPPSPPPQETPPPPPPPPKQVRVRQPQPPAPPQAPIPNETPKEPPKTPPAEPPKPVFGVSMASTTEGESSFAVNVGNTTVADPKNTAPKEEVRPLPPAPPGSAPASVFRPASPLEIAEDPKLDDSSCEIPPELYPDEPRELGIEGETILRVEISEQAKVVGVRVIRGAHKQLDELAVRWVKTRWRIRSPARNKSKQPVPYAITYKYRWELTR